MGTIFFFLTVICIPFLPAGAEIPRWAFMGLVAAGLFFRLWPSPLQWLLIGYLTLMTYVSPIGYDAALIYCHFVFLMILFIYAQRLQSLKTIAHGMAIALTINSLVVIAESYRAFMFDVSGHGGLFFNRNMAGEAAAMVLVLVIGYRLYWCIPGLLPTMFWGGRGPMVALCVAGMLYLWKFSRLAALAVLPVGAGLAILVWLQHADGQDIFETLDARLGVLADTIPHLNILGHGLGSFIGDFPLYQRHSTSLNIRYENTHNDIVQVIYELGLAGAVLLSWLFCRLVRAERSPAWYCMVVFLVEGCFGFPLYKPVTGGLAAVCTAYLLVRSPAVRDLLDPVRRRIGAWLRHQGYAALPVGIPVVSTAESAS